uniref:Uncharacterized protein n=1 Tax=Arundo donax TaxID=35708 RepID=A0A0A9C2U5_ARUDO
MMAEMWIFLVGAIARAKK